MKFNRMKRDNFGSLGTGRIFFAIYVFIFFTDAHQHSVKSEESHIDGTSDIISSPSFPSLVKVTTANSFAIINNL